ncbi:hypothetical protein GC089_15900 [Cellulomonas sp. JZ18]|uniref:hypothetical protein n=1 Tax=Cellulomonas sp. JZ18 TaxID=2654191 RepID=UPI0012D413DA|nr:hypothetical protein [Cellulomonas sp. JZ18]QGQ20399.1 hypothetical protein GC089_15900 [Cellulomonas sp. JZ18]
MQTASPTLPAGTAPAVAPGSGPVVLARPLAPAEAAHLDRLRAWLHDDGVDVRDPQALDARWARLLATHAADAPPPAGVTAALGIAVGDLLVHAVPDAVWMMCPGPEGATPGVVAGGRVHMPVLAVLDAHARWRLRTPPWTVDYVRRATAHLTAPAPALPAPALPVPTGPSDAADATGTSARPAAPGTDGTADQTRPDVAPPAAGRHAAPPPATGWEPVRVPTGSSPAPVLPTRGRRGAQPSAAASAAPAPSTGRSDAPPPASDRPAPPAPAAHAVAAPADATPPPALLPDAGPTAGPGPLDDPAPTSLDAPEPVLPEADVVTASTPVVAPVSTLTPEDLPHRPTPRVQDLALRALEHALEQALADERGVAPFVLVQDEDGFHVTTFAHGSAGVAEARDHARRCRLSAAAVGWTSPADDTRPYPRVVVDASAAGQPGMRVAHAFVHDADGGHEVGGPEVVGQAAPVL